MEKFFKEMINAIENIAEENFNNVLEKSTCPKATRITRQHPFVAEVSIKPNATEHCKKPNTPFVCEDFSFLKDDPVLKFPFKKMIDRVIFQDPATIVLWKDGTKTVVKTQGNEKYDKEKGLAMCIVKYMSGNTGMYYETFKKFCDVEEKEKPKHKSKACELLEKIASEEIEPQEEDSVLTIVDTENTNKES